MQGNTVTQISKPDFSMRQKNPKRDLNLKATELSLSLSVSLSLSLTVLFISISLLCTSLSPLQAMKSKTTKQALTFPLQIRAH